MISISVYPLFIIAAAFLWALDGVVIRPALYTLPVTLVVFIEHSLGLILMLPLLYFLKPNFKKISKRGWISFLLVALFGGVLGTMFITKALFYVNFIQLSVVVLLQKLQPVFALILARIILGEQLPRRFFWLAGIAIVGAYLVTFPNLLPNITGGTETVFAALFAIGAAFSWGASTVFSKDALKNSNFVTGTFLRFLITSVIMVALVIFSGTVQAINNVTFEQWKLFFIIVFSSGAAAMFIYYYGLQQVKASVSTICELFFPLSAIFLEFLVRGLSLSSVQWLGAGLLIVSMYFVTIQYGPNNLKNNTEIKV